ncbi:MAG TPA: IPTL-CTERM sorting domain-containing protein [Thermoanaerobaculia bacterium]|nr:IPTL-CTERM sorting domain-containing protein [Thermoanaerobaculia bacterium]
MVLAATVLLSSATAAVQEVKDPNPPRPGAIPNSTDTTGGPDAFGYTFADGNETTCGPGSIIDISGTGTNVISGDDAAAPVTLGSAFNFYGTSVTQMALATNGYISTDPTDTGPDLSNDCPLPAPPSTGGGARIYPLHDDLILNDPNAAFYQYFPVCPRQSDRCATNEPCSVFMWNNVEHFGGGGESWDVETILYHTTNDIVYLIGPGNPETGSGSTTGIQNFPPPTTGLTYACNVGGSIPDNTRVCIFHPTAPPGSCSPGDLEMTKSVAPATVPPGGTTVFTLTVTNNGPGSVSSVMVTDSLDPQLTYVSNDCGASFAAPTVTWSVGTLANGASATCNVTVSVSDTASGQIANVATATGAGSDPNTSNNTSTVALGVQPPTLSIPTLSEIGLGLLALVMAASAVIFLRRRKTA